MSPNTTDGSGWTGDASTTELPPADYWAHLEAAFPGQPVEGLRELSGRRNNEFDVSDLPPPRDPTLLEAMAGDGWVRREVRVACADDLCDHQPTDEDIAARRCPVCDAALTVDNTTVVVYVRDLERTEDVDWVVVIHGMNTKGAWQEEFSWFLSTTWGKSIPVWIYKYGIVITGVIMAWRRRKLRRNFRAKLAALRDQAHDQGYGAVPDVVAHSFGTWLLGHMLQGELARDAKDRLRFRRVILAGCVLRPDFDWKALKEAGIVGEVLNHYGTKDPIVPLAHWIISGSGPSGRRGFDGDDVINIPAVGLGHSDLFSVVKCVADGKWRQPCPPEDARGHRHLDHTYETYWKPFLTLPVDELGNLPDIAPPTTGWRPAPAPLRGTVFPFVALPLLAALLALVVGLIGEPLSEVLPLLLWIVGAGLGALVFLGIGIALMPLWRRLGKA